MESSYTFWAKRRWNLLILSAIRKMNTAHTWTMLCLGDSYTIGEAVKPEERFPVQAISLLRAQAYRFSDPVIIAQTGWTTDELAAAIHDSGTSASFDFVTLLIGVNNQYRGRDLENYHSEFTDLLQTAINYADGNTSRVFVLSIPDWGVTPFVANDAKSRTPDTVSREIDDFNRINREVAIQAGANYLDITPGSRLAGTHPELLASDGLHPSGLMYRQWAEKLADAIVQTIQLT